MALRDDVPSVPRNELNVLSDLEWQQDKRDFVYESWVQQALQADGVTGQAAEAAVQRH